MPADITCSDNFALSHLISEHNITVSQNKKQEQHAEHMLFAICIIACQKASRLWLDHMHNRGPKPDSGSLKDAVLQ